MKQKYEKPWEKPWEKAITKKKNTKPKESSPSARAGEECEHPADLHRGELGRAGETMEEGRKSGLCCFEKIYVAFFCLFPLDERFLGGYEFLKTGRWSTCRQPCLQGYPNLRQNTLKP